MSAQFGRWNLDGLPADPGYLAKAREILAPYGPDDGDTYIKDTVGVLFRAFHTTGESRKERQPLVTASGTVICWDGRLDNREALIRDVQGRDRVTAESTDLAVVAAAYGTWGTTCFAELTGDWALSIWDAARRSLLLAKDPIGTRPLYYSFDEKQIVWSTILDPLVLLAGKKFQLEEEYIAGWLSFFPAAHLTPYAGIHSVPPSCVVTLEPGRHTVTKYWDFDAATRIRYRTDREYEEHFRQVFGESVRRRLRSDSPVLAELSGGMDSSAIVCMADALIERGAAETARLDTISYFDDSEPNWNERPYFRKVEEKRGRIGVHIDVSVQPQLRSPHRQDFAVTPNSRGRTANQLFECLAAQGNRVVLSGIGGDEVMGGVPTPVSELADLLATLQFRVLAQQLKAWSLSKRKPWFHLLLEAAKRFLPERIAGVPKRMRPAPWLTPGFVLHNRAALRGYETRLKVCGPWPSFQENLSTLEALRRELACHAPLADPPREYRYPFLDRSLLEFVYAVPREQLVRPGQRRSLMRRALAGIVPEDILNRRRKAYVARAPLAAIAADADRFTEIVRDMAGPAPGIVEPEEFLEALERARHGQETPTIPILRTLAMAAWLKGLEKQEFFAGKHRGSADDVGKVGERFSPPGRAKEIAGCAMEFGSQESNVAEFN